MLEIKGVHKTYTPKKGVPVKALDGVDLKFEDNGMVFILGKSGSGKSTLLNVLGGLDVADEGEFIIKGKSSKDFTQSDFDSYRNTFIGFIFQEYNILSEFTVGANIALAMELQGQKATNEALDEILKDVDLDGYANRKPNELSGGQKQRVAIARALIKNPEIIMADEPTGALDSNTGKQVFDTLKKLSKNKLVLIVSHDRDFAELYADRIIELKDGKVISDVSKKSIPPEKKTEGISVIDEKVICVKKGYKLSQKDLALINEYISKSQADTLISIDENKNDEIKKVVKINDDGGKDAFDDTTADDIRLKEYAPADSNLIRSRLPYRNALKMGASSLKVKPVRLVFTIILCLVAFALFGISDTMASYDKVTTYVSSISQAEIEYASFKKTARRGSYSYANGINANDEDIALIKEKTGITVVPVYNGAKNPNYLSNAGSFTSLFIKPSNIETNVYPAVYDGGIKGYAEYTNEFLAENGIEFVAGNLPSNDNEIAIPLFIYDQIKLCGLTYIADDDSTAELSADEITPQLVVGKTINGRNLNVLDAEKIKIVGIFDTRFDANAYEDFLPSGSGVGNDMSSQMKSMKVSETMQYGFHSVVAVNQGVQAKMIAKAQAEEGDDRGVKPDDAGGYMYLNSDYVFCISSLGEEKGSITIDWVDGEKTQLANDEIIAPYFLFDEYRSKVLNDEMIRDIEAEFGITFSAENYDGLKRITINDLRPESLFRYFDEIITTQQVPDAYINEKETAENNLNWRDDTTTDYKQKHLQGYRNYVLTESDVFVNEYDGNVTASKLMQRIMGVVYKALPLSYYTGGKLEADGATASKDVAETKIVGYYYYDEYDYSSTVDYTTNPLIVSDEIFSLFDKNAMGNYAYLIGAMPYNNRSALKKVVSFSLKNNDGISYSLSNEASVIIEYVDNIVETMSKVFLYIGIAFAVFASLLMFNFISVSITQKKREIGILRAVGARSSDVFVIFLNESLIITIINFILSTIVTAIICAVINSVFIGYGLTLTILNFGFRQIALLLGVGVLVAVVASFFPVMNISRKRPIDAIQNR